MAGVLALTALLSTPATAADSLSTPIARDGREALWPVEISVEIIALPPPDVDSTETPARPQPLPARTVVVPDGHRLRFASVVRTPRGRRTFDFAVVARRHPETVELEWDLLVEDALYRRSGIPRYLLHRLRLLGPPEVRPSVVRYLRADIVDTRESPYRDIIEVGDQRYEIRLFARALRG